MALFGKTKNMAEKLADVLNGEFDGLIQAKTLIDKEIAGRSVVEVECQKNKLSAMANSLGITVASLFGMTSEPRKEVEKKERKKREVKIKYRDPSNPAQVWTGIGKPKNWLQEKIEAGENKDTYRIKEESVAPK